MRYDEKRLDYQFLYLWFIASVLFLIGSIPKTKRNIYKGDLLNTIYE